MSNYNNLAQRINYLMGSFELNLPMQYIQTTALPGINFSHIELTSGYGARINAQADTMSFNSLNLTLLLDENFKNYRELMERAFSSYNPENGTFAQRDFNIFLLNNNLKGNFLFKVDFFNCKIESIDDIDLTVNDDAIPVTFSVTIKYDYYKFDFTDEGYKKAWKNLEQNSNVEDCKHFLQGS